MALRADKFAYYRQSAVRAYLIYPRVVCDLSVERTRLFIIQRNAPWFIRPRGVKGDAMNRKRDSITRSGSDLLFRVLRQSTIGVSGFHFRVRNGIECFS